MSIRRRIGSSPALRGSLSGQTCPDLVELHNGDFIAIGRLTTDPAIEAWLTENGGGIADYERAVILPRQLVLDAAAQIAAERMPDTAP